MRFRLAAAVAAMLGLAAPAAAFSPADPLAGKQWYLTANRTYDSWATPPTLTPVKIGIIDSGIDLSHPELAKHVIAARSFVGGKTAFDLQGHGTFVAGVIAAELNDGIGIAGSFPAAQLIVAKVVTPQRTIPVEAEARAIRWVVDQGARVINMSLGGVRDPLRPSRDTYSQAEADAVRYAVAHGVLIVAAAGNGDQSPREPWRFASYPAALPHVLGVGAFAQDGSVPDFSNRDAIYVDIAAPGEAILSTLPLRLTAQYPGCADQGYSDCGPEDFRSAEGTSFAAPQVTAAAATLLSLNPDLTSDQLSTLLEQTATDANNANGCRPCRTGRDAYTGWGRLNVATAVGQLPVPPRQDRLEPNDDAGPDAAPLSGGSGRLRATVDFWDDQSDVYRIHLRRGQKLFAVLSPPTRTDTALALWKPGARHVDDLRSQDLRVRHSPRSRGGGTEKLSYRARRAGFYYLQVKIEAEGSGQYKLEWSKTPP
jgi:subtilisin family serine protease